MDWRFPFRNDRRSELASLLAGVAASLILAAAATAAEPQPALLVVSYVETPVGATAAVERSLLAYADRTRKLPGAPSVEVLREIGRPQRMAVIERWAPGAAPDEGALQRDMEGRLQAPVDRRTHRELGALMTSAAAAPFHMLMHVDVVPAGAELAAGALQAQRAPVLAAPGGRGFEAATQSDRANHFAVHETWANRAAYEAYVAGPAAQELRRRLAIVKGSLFDDRFFETVANGGRKQ